MKAGAWLLLIGIALVSGGLVGFSLKRCPDVAPAMVDTGALDSLTTVANLAEARAAAQKSENDTLRSYIERIITTRPTTKAAITDAYSRLHLPVDSLAERLLADPE